MEFVVIYMYEIISVYINHSLCQMYLLVYVLYTSIKHVQAVYVSVYVSWECLVTIATTCHNIISSHTDILQIEKISKKIEHKNQIKNLCQIQINMTK